MKCVFEWLGTMVLILLGDGVCAGNSLNKTKGQGGGWIVITIAWGLAVMCGVFIAGPYSGAHLNPAVTIGLALAGKFAWSEVLGYIVALQPSEIAAIPPTSIMREFIGGQTL